MFVRLPLSLVLVLISVAIAAADPMSYLEPICDPYYPHAAHPKLTTPQWVGEQGVDAVVILSIDDMRDSAKYEQFLRPLLNRLKQIDGRAPVSIFANAVDPSDSQLQAWLKEGLSLETHTADHPCPLLCDGDFAKAKSTYERCVDQLFQVPNSRPVAFRMPCCDSLNTPSPRFWTEIFSKTSEAGNYLQLDSSVFNVFTAADPSLPRDWVTREDGSSRFRYYLPFPSFVNTIEDYPYPYIIGNDCWEFPCVVPSDWEAQNVQQPNNPKTVEDWKRALDITVHKQGVMPIVFHPHGWIRIEQLVAFVDYAEATYGQRVKFLTFDESLQRIQQHLLDGVPVRDNEGNRHRVRLVDVNQDGYMDVYRQESTTVVTRTWNETTSQYDEYRQEIAVGDPHFGVRDGRVHYLVRDTRSGNLALYVWNDGWRPKDLVLQDVDVDLEQAQHFLHDIDADGTSELFLADGAKQTVLQWKEDGFQKLPYALPVSFVDPHRQRDRSVRLVDLNGDGRDDILKSSSSDRQVWLFDGPDRGWRSSSASEPQLAEQLPPLVAADGTNNGAWFHSQHVWVQNEHTARMPDLVDRVPFQSLVKPAQTDEEHPLGKAKSLEESLDTLQVVGGGRLEVVAAEPGISDPVAFDWGPGGELWVAEMGDYPNGARWHGPGDPQGDPGGRVRLLRDQDGDGRFETSHLFLDGLHVPTGVKAFRNGVLVCVAPHILFAEDTNGDSVADKQTILYQGLREGNQQHRANGLRWGLDHWLHLANGDSGGQVRSLKTGETIDIRGRDFRIHPDSGRLQLTSGQTQFGRSRDNQGNWFGGNNSEPAWHYVLDEHYQARNPYVSSPSARHVTSVTPGASPVYPTSKTLQRFNDFDRADRFTSACSTEVSRHDDADVDYLYVCEPVHNLVHRSVLSRDGVTFSSDRAADEQNREFVTSSDNWFRPVMVRYGPDDAIWIADMYRQVIEHPEWIPMDWQKRIDHLGGHDKGRIYRVVFDKPASQAQHWQQIRQATTQQLVAMIDSPNGVLRDMVQQELYERRDAEAVPLLKSAYRQTRWPAVRMPITHLLHAQGAVDETFVLHAFEVGLVDTALLRVAESQFNSSVELRDRLFAWLPQAVTDSAMRIPIAYLLGEVDDPRSAEWLARLVMEYGEDAYVRAAVMSSIRRENVAALLTHVVQSTHAQGTAFPENPILHDTISIAVGTEHAEALHAIAGLISSLDNPDKLGVLSMLREQLARHDKEAQAIFEDDDLALLHHAATDGRKIVRDPGLSLQQRTWGLSAFGFWPDAAHRAREIETLPSLLAPTSPPQLQIAALEHLQRMGESNAADAVFENWAFFAPAIREAAVRVSLEDTAWTHALLQAIERGDVPTREIGVHYQTRLREHRDAGIREQASQRFQPIPSDREGLLQDYLEQPSESPNPTHGKDMFTRQCSACHQLEGQGRAVGPDLTALTDKSRPALLTAILDPNRAVEDKYLSYTIVLRNGTSYVGMLAQESATSLTLATAEGTEQVILRDQIEAMQCTGKSLMPEGLERTLTPSSMNDLIHYVQSIRARRKEIPGNQPQVAPVRDDGSIRLFAMHAEIYGPDLTLESKYRNLGFWHSESDRAVWTVHAKKAGRYSLSVDYACPTEHAGNRFQVRVAGQKLTHTVESTGSWDRYQGAGVGSILLPAEPVQITVAAEGPVEGYLFDLRTIILWPQ